ncbi:MAG TPA: hypothetical protein VG963_23310 [Polyangiaceae bacterium]|nr:hypothetical protein [Polyangiaceae bacterium]
MAAIERRPSPAGVRSWAAPARLAFALFAAPVAGCQDGAAGLHVSEVDATFAFAHTHVERIDAATTSADDDEVSRRDEESSAPVEDGSISADDASSASASAPAAVPIDAGPPPRSCQHLAEFTKQVMPAILDRCVRCHDGTKSKATKPFDLTSARDQSMAAQQRTCDQVLKNAPDTSEQSPIFAEVNPGDPTTVHDFKYPSSMAYMEYRDTVLVWLQTE